MRPRCRTISLLNLGPVLALKTSFMLCVLEMQDSLLDHTFLGDILSEPHTATVAKDIPVRVLHLKLSPIYVFSFVFLVHPVYDPGKDKENHSHYAQSLKKDHL